MIYIGKQYSTDFKLEAIKRKEKSGESVTMVAIELGVKPTTIGCFTIKDCNIHII
jgi:transposase